MVVWSDDGQSLGDQSTSAIFGRVFTIDGSDSSGTFQINSS